MTSQNRQSENNSASTIFNLKIVILSSAEPDPDFKFVRPLPKKSAGYTTKDIDLEAQVNSHKAIVHWYKGDEKLEVKS